MRTRDLGEQFLDGFEDIDRPLLRWGKVIAVQTEDVEVAGVTVPVRSLTVEWLDSPGRMDSIPFVESWGTCSLPPLNSVVLVGFEKSGTVGPASPVVLGFYGNFYNREREEGRESRLSPGEESKIRKGLRLHILSSFEDLDDFSGDSPVDIDLILADQSNTVGIPYSSAVWQSFEYSILRRVEECLVSSIRNSTIVLAEQLAIDAAAISEEEFRKHYSYKIVPAMLAALESYRTQTIFPAFVSIVENFVKSSEVQSDVDTSFYDRVLKPIILEGYRVYLISKLGEMGLSEAVKQEALEILMRHVNTAVDLGDSFARSVQAFLISKVRAYFKEKIQSLASKAITEVEKRALRVLRRDLFASLNKKLWSLMPRVEGFEAFALGDFLAELKADLERGLEDPEVAPIVDLRVRTRHEEERFLRFVVRKDGDVEISVGDDLEIYMDSEGEIFLRCRGLDAVLEALNVSAKTVQVRAEEAKVVAEREVRVEGEKVVVESGDVELGGEDGVRVVRDGDDVVISASFLSKLIAHTHPLPPPLGSTGTAVFGGLYGTVVGNSKSSSKKVKAE